jgi:predicted dehydrogenase
MNQGVHAVDLLQWLVGLPREVSAFAATLAHPGVEAEDTLAATLRFPNGALGVIEAATSCYPGSDLRLEILGDKGSATIVDDRIVRWDFAEKREGDDEIMRPEEGPGIAGGTSDPKAISNEGHRRLVDDLAAAIQQGRAPMIPGSDARKAVALVLAIYESARTGRATPVDGAS